MFKDEQGTYHFSGEQEVQELLLAQDPDVTEAVLSGNLVLDGGEQAETDQPVVEEAPTEETLAPEQVPSEPSPEPTPEPIPEPEVKEEPVQDNSLQVEELIATMKAEQERQKKEYEDKLLDLKKSIEETKIKEKQESVVEPEPVVNIDLGEEDPDLATDFEKNTRKLVESIKANTQSTPEQARLLEALQSRLDKIEKADEEAREEKARQERLKILYNEMQEFAKGKEHFDVPVAIGDARIEQNRFKEEMSKVLGINLDNHGEVERQYRKIAAEDTVWARQRRELLREKGVEIPEYTKNYVNLLEIYERKQGRKFNMYSGKYEDITDATGAVSRLPSLDDAFKLSKYYSLVSEAETRASLEIQQKLEEQQDSVAVIDNARTSDLSGKIDISEADAIYLLNLDKQALMNNPDLLRNYSSLMSQLGETVPKEIQQALDGLK